MDSELKIPEGGEVASNLTLENAPMNLSEYEDDLIEEVIGTSEVVQEVTNLVMDEEVLIDKIRANNSESPVLDYAEGVQDGLISEEEVDLDKVVIK